MLVNKPQWRLGSTSKRRSSVVGPIAALAAVLVVVALGGTARASTSSADIFAKSYGWGVSDGGSSFETCTSACQVGVAGAGAGQFDTPQAIATDGSRTVYVADETNQRIDEFSADGAFVKAYGWGVSDGDSSFETCSSSCQKGTAGGGAGQLQNPDGIATDSAGDVYVGDQNNYRIDEFSATGAFIKAYGWGVSDGGSSFETCTSTCQKGIAGGGAGQFDNPADIAVDGSGNVYVADFSNNRIDEFTAAGAFEKAYGWGVSDGGSSFETCTSTCEAGASGGGPGQFYRPAGIDTDSSGDVYVAEQFNNRVDEFSAAGAFVEAYGWGVDGDGNSFEICTSLCNAGLDNGGAGASDAPSGLAVDAFGNVYLADTSNERVEQFVGLRTLDVSIGGTGHGRVTGAGLSCSGSCAKTYVSGSVLTLTAAASAGSRFAGWSGCTVVHTTQCAVTMSSDQQVTARFSLRPPNTTITKSTISQAHHRATFTFTATGKPKGFQCALVRLPKAHHIAPKPHFTSCKSPKAYKNLKADRYEFEVRGDNAGGADPTPAKKIFKIG